MFFAISPNPEVLAVWSPNLLTNFSQVYTLGSFIIGTDAGWYRRDTDTHTCIYKGYADSARLPDLLDQIVEQIEPKLFGCFCVLVYDKLTEQLHIKTDRLRGFPLYHEERVGVTNLLPMAKTAWSDNLLTINSDFSFTEEQFDIVGNIDDTPVTLEEVTNFIDQRLTEKTQNLLKYNTLPIKAFLSGGVDTTLVYSYLKKYATDFELVKGNVVEFDRFWVQNSVDIGDHYWGYKQIHQWRAPTMLTSGTPGDEFMLRSPMYSDQYLKYHGMQITDLLNSDQRYMHTDYFSQKKNLELFARQTVDRAMTPRQFQKKLCNYAANDWQHWHIGNTLTWTPLRDLEVYKMFLRLEPMDAVTQIMDSAVSVALIERNCPGLSRTISDQKNTGNYLKNLADYLFGEE